MAEKGPLTSTDTEKLYGTIDDQGGYQPFRRSSRRRSRHYVSFNCKLITFIVCLVVIAAVSFIPFIALHYLPYPTTTSIQFVRQNDTLPLYFITKADLPPSYSTYWYEYAEVRMNTDSGNEPNIPVDLFYIEGQSACSPFDNNIAVENADLTKPISQGETIDVVVNKYLTFDSNMTLDITISESESETGTLTVYIVDDKKDYDCFQDGGSCKFFDSFSFQLKNGPIDQLNYTFSQPSYYFMILTSTASATVEYSFELTYQFYKLADYKPTSTCSIDEQNEWEPCKFPLNDTQGCLFAHSPLVSGSPSFADLSVTVVHKVFTLPSYLAVYFGGAITILMIAAVAGVVFLMVKYWLYSYSYSY